MPDMYSDLLRRRRSGDWIPVKVRFSAPVQTGPTTHPASYTMDTGPIPRAKQLEHDIDHPPLSSTQVTEIVELYLYS